MRDTSHDKSINDILLKRNMNITELHAESKEIKELNAELLTYREASFKRTKIVALVMFFGLVFHLIVSTKYLPQITAELNINVDWFFNNLPYINAFMGFGFIIICIEYVLELRKLAKQRFECDMSEFFETYLNDMRKEKE